MTPTNPYEPPTYSAEVESVTTPSSLPTEIVELDQPQHELVRHARAMRPWQGILAGTVAIVFCYWLSMLVRSRLNGGYVPFETLDAMLYLIWCVSLGWIALELAILVWVGSQLRAMGRIRRVRRYCKHLGLLCVATSVCVGVMSYFEFRSVLFEVQLLNRETIGNQ